MLPVKCELSDPLKATTVTTPPSSPPRPDGSPTNMDAILHHRVPTPSDDTATVNNNNNNYDNSNNNNNNNTKSDGQTMKNGCGSSFVYCIGNGTSGPVDPSGSTNQSSIIKTERSFPVFRCDQCEYETFSLATLSSHRKTHAVKRLFQCDVCHMKFSQAANMRRHRMRHTGVKPYECRVCCKRFFRKDHLMEHTVTHAKQPPFRCPLCGRDFHRQAHLREHLTSEHNGNDSSVPMPGLSDRVCRICGHRAATAKGAKLHYTSRHNRGNGNANSTASSSKNPETTPAAQVTSMASESHVTYTRPTSTYLPLSAGQSGGNVFCYVQTPPPPYTTPFPYPAAGILSMAMAAATSSSGSANDSSNDHHHHRDPISSSSSGISIRRCCVSPPPLPPQQVSQVSSVFAGLNRMENPQTGLEISIVKQESISPSLPDPDDSNNSPDDNDDDESADLQPKPPLPPTPDSSRPTRVGSAYETTSETGSASGGLQCCHCGIIFPDQTLYFLHKGLHSEGNPWKCNICGEICQDKYEFNAHVLSKAHQ